MKTNKYKYLKVIQQNYGQGWEDNSEYAVQSTGMPHNTVDRSLIYNDLKEYRLTGYPTRLIFRKELINQ